MHTPFSAGNSPQQWGDDLKSDVVETHPQSHFGFSICDLRACGGSGLKAEGLASENSSCQPALSEAFQSKRRTENPVRPC